MKHLIMAAMVCLCVRTGRAQAGFDSTTNTSGAPANVTSGPPVRGYIPNGLVAWWKLNDDSGTMAADSSGNGHAMTLVGSPTWGANDLTLNGTSQYGDAGTNAAEVAQRDMTVS